jgi:mono/diheme cytochrome c family protein
MKPTHALPVVLIAAALAGAGCGGGGDDASTSDSAAPPATTQQQTQTQAQQQSGSSQTRTTKPAKGPDGAQVFASAGCEGCHTLAAAGSTGNVGPNLDDLKPDFQTVKNQVENGGGGMPAFGGDLSSAEIDAVARYVSDNAGR